MRMAVFMLSLGLTAWSCASAPRRQPVPVHPAVPATWTVARGRPSAGRVDSTLSAWWSHFQDAQLGALVEESLAHNFDLQAAAGRIDAAQARAKIAGAPLYPQLNLSFNSTRRRQNFIGFPIPGQGRGVLSTTSTRFGVSTELSWEIDLWRRIGAGKAAALADYEVAQADFHGARLSLSGQTAKAWFAAIEARRQRELAEATLDNFRTVHAGIRNRYQRGLRPSLDVRLSLSNVAAAEAAVAQRRRQFDGAVRQLETLLGRYPTAELAVASDLPPMPGPVPAGLPADLIARRPDLVMAERRVAASNARIAGARRAQYPRITLTGSTGTSSTALANILSGDFIAWNIAGGLLHPLFQGGRLRAGVALAKSTHEQALASFTQQALRAYGEIESALAAEAFLKDQERALRVAREQAVAARGLAEDRYARGLDDVITMLDAQRRAFDTEGRYIAVRHQRLDRRVDLYLALGGDFGN